MKTLTELELKKYLDNFQNWQIRDKALYREFKMDSFNSCMDAMQKIAVVCEELNHHPEWTNCYNKLQIKLTTHYLGGLSELDFKLAEAIEKFTSIE